MDPVFFNNSDEFREWLIANHSRENELWVGFYKVKSGKPSMSWSQSVDQALCFGWIDGIRKSIDHERYCIRFTPRKSTSNWSTINIKKVDELTRKGLMQPTGLEVFKNRKVDNTEQYSYENKPEKLSPDLENRFRSNRNAWSYFTSQAISYQRTVFFWIMSAKREETKHNRLKKLIDTSNAGKRLF